MTTFTYMLKDVVRLLYCEDYDFSQWEQPYASFTYKESTYGKLPTLLPDFQKIGLGYYPIFDEEYRPILNGKILDEYFVREIGTETIDMFTLMIRRKMDQIMPYFNQLYLSLQIPYDALSTMEIHTVNTGDVDTTQSSTTSSDSSSDTKSNARSVSSSTPQTMLSGNEDYASGATDSNGDTNVTANGNQTSDGDSKTTRNLDSVTSGFQSGSAAELMIRYRASLINIDVMVLNSIEDCFMNVLNNGDAYTGHNDYDLYGWY